MCKIKKLRLLSLATVILTATCYFCTNAMNNETNGKKLVNKTDDKDGTTILTRKENIEEILAKINKLREIIKENDNLISDYKQKEAKIPEIDQYTDIDSFDRTNIETARKLYLEKIEKAMLVKEILIKEFDKLSKEIPTDLASQKEKLSKQL